LEALLVLAGRFVRQKDQHIDVGAWKELAPAIPAGRDERGPGRGRHLAPDLLERAVDQPCVLAQQAPRSESRQETVAQDAAAFLQQRAPAFFRSNRPVHAARRALYDAGGGGVPAETVSTSGPLSVTRIVCSHCAERLWSLVTIVHPSASSRIAGLPALIIGATLKGIPGSSCIPVPARAECSPCGSSWTFRPIPWPQNSRTIENPCCSACTWIAAPMSPRRPPGFASAIPRHMHSYVTSTSRRAWMLGGPTENIRLQSPWK